MQIQRFGRALSPYLSRHLDLVEDIGDDIVSGDIVGLSLVRESDTMTHHVVTYGSDILRDDIATSLDERISPGSLRERD